MRWVRRMVGCSVAMGAVFVASLVAADVGDAVVRIVHGDQAASRIAGDDQARVVPLHRGEWGYLGELRLEPGAELHRQARSEEEYLYVLGGTAVLVVDGERFLIGPRMGVYLPAGVEVEWHNGASRLVMVQLHAGPSPGIDRDRWLIEPDDVIWPRPRMRPRPAPAEVSETNDTSVDESPTSKIW